MQEKTVENLVLTSNILMEVTYEYFALLKKDGQSDLHFMVKVDDIDVLIQYDADDDRIVITVPREEFELPQDELERAEFPVTALLQVVATYFQRQIMETKGNGTTVTVDGLRYNVWYDETDQQVKFNMDAEDRKKQG